MVLAKDSKENGQGLHTRFSLYQFFPQMVAIERDGAGTWLYEI
jgi:hypothetical protein